MKNKIKSILYLAAMVSTILAVFLVISLPLGEPSNSSKAAWERYEQEMAYFELYTGIFIGYLVLSIILFFVSAAYYSKKRSLIPVAVLQTLISVYVLKIFFTY